MTLTEFAQTGRAESYRIGTAHRDKLPGVTVPSFRCKCCGQVKATTGRAQVVKGAPKFGYKCAACVAAEAGVTA